ncbi:MAG: sporulation protein YtfJ [Clostridiales bacterium]|nr:sporulation protein YtfJ [Clostridiales bacterium]
MKEHPIEALMQTTMESIKNMVDVNTIVGDAVETNDGTVIIPISKVSFGFASGGGDYTIRSNNENNSDENSSNDRLPFAGGAGAGVSVQPVAFMVVGNGHIKLMSVDQRANMIDNLINSTPKIIQGLQNAFGKRHKNNFDDMIFYE